MVTRLKNNEQLERNIAKVFTEMCKCLLSYCKGVYRKQREAASHVFAFMIAEEKRNVKPYAIPVRFFPDTSITDQKVRHLKQRLVDKRKKLDMLSVGMYCTFVIVICEVFLLYCLVTWRRKRKSFLSD